MGAAALARNRCLRDKPGACGAGGGWLFHLQPGLSTRRRVSSRDAVQNEHRADLIFSTVSGKPISPNNVLRTWIWPACRAADLPRVTWLTFRRTYSSWAPQKGVPSKVVAAIMGHAKVDTTLNVYTQVLDGAAREAADRVGSQLARIGQTPGGATALIH
jgi:integrase